jgi:rSAM/selenodomain-associated transferase 1
VEPEPATISGQRRSVLGVLAKYWTPGQVKTRLARAVGLATAAEIHRQFVIHLSTSLRTVADRRIFVVAPSERQSEFQSVLPAGCWETAPQADGDLGRRMEAWFRESLATGAPNQQVHSVLIGADCPCLHESELNAAFQALSGSDVVLGPASDGGYYLIGLRGPWRDENRRLFDEMPWSSEHVYEQTRTRIDQAGLSLSLLPEREDIDTVDELNRLRRLLKSPAEPGNVAQRLAEQLDTILGPTP